MTIYLQFNPQQYATNKISAQEASNYLNDNEPLKNPTLIAFRTPFYTTGIIEHKKDLESSGRKDELFTIPRQNISSYVDINDKEKFGF